MKCILVISTLVIGLCLADFPTELPDIDSFEAIKTRCDSKGGAGTYDRLKKAQNETETCLKGIINFETLKTEVEESKKTGSMDEVFGKYCNKRPQMRACIKKTVDIIKTCLDDSERQALNSTADIVEKVGEFACYKDGDRIAMFIAEGGVECISSRTENIINCVNQTIKFNPATFSPNSIPNLQVDKKKCDDLTTIQNCVVKDLEDNCEESTPSNMIEAIFKFIKKNVCKNPKTRSIRRFRRDIKKALTAIQADIRAEIDRKLEATCKKFGNKDAYEKLMASFNKTTDCLKPIRVFVTPYGVFQASLINCTADVREALRDCVSDKGKYYPDLVLERLQAFYGFVYNHADQFFVTPESNSQWVKCLQAINPPTRLVDCLKRPITIANETFYHVPPKMELCRLSIEGDECIARTIKEMCAKDIKITKFLDDLFEAMQVPCQKKTDQEIK